MTAWRGTAALEFNDTGEQNTATGAFARFSNIEGIRNTAIGSGARLNNTSDSNTAIGADALSTNTTGGLNVAIGNIALRDNEGNGSTAIGIGALFQATGGFNTAVGRLAGQSITTGNNIIAIGVQVDGISTVFGEVDDSCYIDNIFNADIDLGTASVVGVDADGKLGTNTVDAAGNKVPLASLLGGQRQAMLNELRKEQKEGRGIGRHGCASRGNGKRAGRANPKSERPTRGEQASGESRALQTIGHDIGPFTSSLV